MLMFLSAWYRFTIIYLLYPKTFILTDEDWRTLYLFCAIRNNNQCNRFLRWWYTKHKQMVVLIWNMIYLIDAKVIILRPKIFIWMIIYTIMRYQMLKDYTNYYYEIIKRINQFCWMNPCVRPFKLITNLRGILDDPVYLIIMRQIRRL